MGCLPACQGFSCEQASLSGSRIVLNQAGDLSPVFNIQCTKIASDMDGRATAVSTSALLPAGSLAESDRTGVALYPPTQTVSASTVGKFASGIGSGPLQIQSDFPTASHLGSSCTGNSGARHSAANGMSENTSAICHSRPVAELLHDLGGKLVRYGPGDQRPGQSERPLSIAARDREQASITCLQVAGRRQPALQFTAGTIAQAGGSCQHGGLRVGAIRAVGPQ